MTAEPALPREVKALDTPALLRPEGRGLDLGLGRRLDPGWARANAAPDGRYCLRPALWHDLTHRPELPGQLRCVVLPAVRTGEHVQSLLDGPPGDLAALPRAVPGEEGLRRAPAGGLRSVREWQLAAS
ncbi:hypothetical protein ACH4E7_20925 [Kitasatospora sp. NPDC018058]|uniref:hypothetical protein n=1 Tax=Kitasatospora sp. NPDC018058 TaxID=3364025 RepID=UPI0037C050F2